MFFCANKIGLYWTLCQVLDQRRCSRYDAHHRHIGQDAAATVHQTL